VTFSVTIQLTKMGLYLDDRGNSSTKGAVVQVWKGTGGLNQVWQVMSDGTIRHNGLCLDVVGASKSNGAKIDLWTCTGGANQQFNTRNWRVTNPVSGKVLNDAGYGGNGTQQVLWSNVGTNNEIWGVTPWGITVGPISWADLPSPPSCTFGDPQLDGAILTGPANGVWTDMDTNINGVRTFDGGPYYHVLNGIPRAGSLGGIPELPGTYSLTLDIRNGATVLATSAPVTLVVPPAQPGCVQ